MPFFTNDGIRLYYEIEGEGPPVVMIHGFALNIEYNWKAPKWVEILKDDYCLILLDCRGHGKSDKPHGDSYYGRKMNDDVIKLMEELSIEKANFFGYSNGAHIIFELLFTKPDIFISAILGGFVVPLINNDEEKIRYTKINNQIIKAFKAKSDLEVKDPSYLFYRQVTLQAGNDLFALAGVIAGNLKERIENLPSTIQMKKLLKKIRIPVMTVLGSNDITPGDKTLAAQLIPDSCLFQIQGKDHMSVLRDCKFHMVVKAFLNYVNRK
ncbi:MAG: alpha/beta fold hydrolase [Candidatus Odinarchaeota archaeon]